MPSDSKSYKSTWPHVITYTYYTAGCFPLPK